MSVIVLLSILSIAYLLGVFFPYLKSLERFSFQHLLALSAGLILGIAFVLLLPDAIRGLGEKASLFTLLGLLSIYILEYLLPAKHQHHHSSASEHHHSENNFSSTATFLALSFHSLTDGLTLGALTEHRVEWMFLLSFFIHKFLEAFSINILLKSTESSLRKKIVFNLSLLFCLPLGFLISHFQLHALFISFEPYVLAVSAGVLIHLALLDLLPEVHESCSRKYLSLIYFLIGIFLSLLSLYFHEG